MKNKLTYFFILVSSFAILKGMEQAPTFPANQMDSPTISDSEYRTFCAAQRFADCTLALIAAYNESQKKPDDLVKIWSSNQGAYTVCPSEWQETENRHKLDLDSGWGDQTRQGLLIEKALFGWPELVTPWGRLGLIKWNCPPRVYNHIWDSILRSTRMKISGINLEEYLEQSGDFIINKCCDGGLTITRYPTRKMYRNYGQCYKLEGIDEIQPPSPVGLKSMSLPRRYTSPYTPEQLEKHKEKLRVAWNAMKQKYSQQK